MFLCAYVRLDTWGDGDPGVVVRNLRMWSYLKIMEKPPWKQVAGRGTFQKWYGIEVPGAKNIFVRDCRNNKI